MDVEADAKRGKKHMSKAWLVLVLLVTGWKMAQDPFSQSQTLAEQNQSIGNTQWKPKYFSRIHDLLLVKLVKHMSHGILQSFFSPLLCINQLGQFRFDFCGPVSLESFLLRLKSILIRNLADWIGNFKLITVLSWNEEKIALVVFVCL